MRLHLGGEVGAGLSIMNMEEAAGWPGGVPGRSGHKGLEVRVGVSRKEADRVGRDQVVGGLEPARGLRRHERLGGDGMAGRQQGAFLAWPHLSLSLIGNALCIYDLH